MTIVTLTLWQEIRVIIATVLIGVSGLGMAWLGFWLERNMPEPMHLDPPGTVPLGAFPLSPFPGEDEWTWAADFAAPIGATLAAADAYIARHQVGALR